MTRVLLVGKGQPDRGGIAAYLAQVLASDLSRRHELRFLNLAHDSRPEGGRLSTANLRRTVADAIAVWRCSRDVDIVHVHSALAPAVTIARAGLLAGVARLRRCRVIMHAHGGRLELWLGRGRGRSLFVRVSLTAVNDVVAVSGGGRAALARALGGRRVHLVDNAVDPSSFMGERAPVGPPRVLYAGGLTPRKGVLDLLAASMMLRTRGVEHEVVLAGGTPDEGPEAEARVRRAAGDAAASLLGSVPHEQMPSVYRSADVFCLPSWWEAMPLSVLEAMAAGLPVVATAVGDLARIVEHGVAGLIVPPRRPDLLADALAELLSDPALGVEMGRAGRERVVRQFSIDGLVASLAGLYGTPTDSAR